MWSRKLSAVACLLACAGTYAGEPGQPLPSCDLTELGSRQSFDFGRFRGNVLYVDFWASWCSSCAKSFPFLNTLDREFRADGLAIVGVNLDQDSADATAFLAKRPASFALAADSTGRCPRDFGVVAMPSSFLVDRQGKIRHVLVGFRPGEAGEIRKLVATLLAEPAPSDAVAE